MYRQNNLSKGNLVKQLLLFAFPFVISNLVQTLYSVSDMIIVGQFCGTNSMSGVNIGGQVTNLIMNVAVGLSAGSTVLIAQSVGAGNTKQLNKIIGTLLTSLIIVAVFMTGLMLIFHNSILHMIRTPEESYSEAGKFLNITALGTIFIFGYNALSSIMRGMGDSKSPLAFVSIACVMNIILDLLLVGVFKLGATGAGIATVTSQGFSMILCIVYLRKQKFVFNFEIRSFRSDKNQLKAILKIGIPLSVQMFITNISFLVLTAMVNSIGVTASAAVGAVGKYNGFAILPVFAMSAAISTMCAQNLGAGKEGRAIKTCLIGMGISIAISYTIFIITILFPGQILGIFTHDQELIRIGKPYLLAFSLDYLVIPISFSMNGLFTGAGHTTYTLINNIIAGLLVRIPMAYFLCIKLDKGLFGVGIAASIATCCAILFSIWFFFSGKWKVNKVSKKLEDVLS